MRKLLLFIILSGTALAQVPGFFYSFSLKDKNGSYIDSSSKGYEMKTVKANENADLMLSIQICDDNQTWRFYVGGYGYADMEKTHMLKITNLDNNQTMTIEFPSPKSGGKEKYYRNLYAGEIKFQKGTYTIKLPESDNEWDGLKEKKICPLSWMPNLTYDDISHFQDQK